MGASLSSVTLVGADNTTDPRELAELRRGNPRVEWGIKWHPEREGMPQHPDRSWINKLFRQSPEGAKALHVFGWGVTQFVTGDGNVLSLASQFNRLQLHFRASEATFEPDQLDKAIRAFGKPVITVHNRDNARFTEAITAPNHLVLIDNSEGADSLPRQWQEPVAGKKCGYVGGLSAENVTYEVPRLLKAAEGHRIWAQVGAGVANNHGEFDAGRARQLLHNISRLG